MPILKSALTLRITALSVVAALAVGCASTPPSLATSNCVIEPVSVYDPAEPLNRRIFAFNRTVDDYLLAPVARGYRHLPGFVQSGVHNFVANFGEPKVFINDVLQGNAKRSVRTVGRFALNSTVGLLGLIDVSGRLNIERHKADFGQTFGVWNLANGPIVELPLLGISNLRDAAGRLLSSVVSPLNSDSDTIATLGTVNTAGGIIDGRAESLPLTNELEKEPDYYLALRDAVAQRRASFVIEGKTGSAGSEQQTCIGGERP
ncbi:VacJ family lipoprotein [Pseudomonas stutzeri]|uniref:MlaA family lipoprotein n=1 Tax=Stutzerimonas stutzeri TaxID=316 RepID=UPI001F51A0EB|nr:VacJ family lipoprotein [Stutzerimonas stutzeri]MCI0916645.1 VacJ family lipoprotein [Stutzerimonas stutzeri]